MIVLCSCNFRTAQTTAAGNLDSLCAKSHGVTDRHFHGTAESDTSFQLCSDVLCHKLCVEVGLSDLNHVESNRHTNHLLNFVLVSFDFRTATADYDTRLCAVNEHTHSLAVTLDLDLRHACRLKLFLQVLSDVIVGNKGVAEFFIRHEPSRIPVLNNAHTESVGIYLLTHSLLPPFLSLFP